MHCIRREGSIIRFNDTYSPYPIPRPAGHGAWRDDLTGGRRVWQGYVQPRANHSPFRAQGLTSLTAGER